MRFLIDNQLPLALALHLRAAGHEADHVLDVGLDEADDVQLWVQAAQSKQIIVSKDEDFVYLANRPGDSGRLVWVRLGNCRKAALLAAFSSSLAAIEQAFESGQQIVELR